MEGKCCFCEYDGNAEYQCANDPKERTHCSCWWGMFESFVSDVAIEVNE